MRTTSRLAIALSASALLVIGLGAPAHLANPSAPADMHEWLVADLAGHGVTADTMGSITTWGADGPVTTAMPVGELLELSHPLMAGKAAPGSFADINGLAVPTNHLGPNVGAGNQQLATASGWFFCDFASVFVLHLGPPGDRIVSATPSPVPLPSEPVCGGFYGATSTWSEVVIDLNNAYFDFGCVASVVLVHKTQPVGSLGGYDCGGGLGTAHGNGTLISLDYGFYRLDYFMGQNNAVTVA